MTDILSDLADDPMSCEVLWDYCLEQQLVAPDRAYPLHAYLAKRELVDAVFEPSRSGWQHVISDLFSYGHTVSASGHVWRSWSSHLYGTSSIPRSTSGKAGLSRTINRLCDVPAHD